MKKIFLAIILCFFSFMGFSKANILKKEVNTVKSKFEKKMISTNPVVLTVTACGQTGTFSWNCSSVSEFLAIWAAIVDEYCHTGNCAV